MKLNKSRIRSRVMDLIERKQLQIIGILFFLCIALLSAEYFLGNEAYAESGNGSYGDIGKVKLKEVEIPVLLYHHIDSGVHAEGATLTQKRFERDMEYLSDNDFTTLLPQDLLYIHSGEMEMPKNPIMISFDDGYESNYLRAFPILKKYQLKATIFVIAKSMDRKVPGQIPKLSWEQMKEMYESGLVEIQSHSFDLHNGDLNGMYFKYGVNGINRGFIESQAMYEARIEKDMKQSIEIIETNVGNEVFAFAYPYGAYDDWCRIPLKNQNMKLAFVLGNKSADVKQDLYQLNRYSVMMNMELDELLNETSDLDVYGRM